MSLTRRQREILDFVTGFIEEHGYSPSFEEIAKNFGFSSLATVHEHLANLKAKGYIRKSFNESRSIEPRVGPSAVELPLLGLVAAGQPIEAIRSDESLAVPEDMIARTGNSFVLKVSGNSMIDEQIRDGDFIIVNERHTALNGEMVVALIDGDAATVKTFYREKDGRVRLQPANPTMLPMFFPAADVQIQGIVIGVLRRY